MSLKTLNELTSESVISVCIDWTHVNQLHALYMHSYRVHWS